MKAPFFSAIALLSLVVASCASPSGRESSAFAGANRLDNGEIDQLDPLSRVAYWGSLHESDPTNESYVVAYAQALRKVGSVDKALQTLEVFRNSSSEIGPDIYIEIGKALIEAGRSHEAGRYLQLALLEDEKNTHAHTVYGVALSQMGFYEDALAQYDMALELAPDDPNILSNKGLTLALDGKLNQAEQTLHKAVQQADASRTTRLNLALTLFLLGKTQQAEALLRANLAPGEAEEAIRYFAQLSPSVDYWSDGFNTDP